MSEKTEEQGLEVFGTKSVSVKEFMGGTDKSLMLLSNYSLAKQNLEGLKAKHEARVEELVLVEKLSPAELKELNSIRGELREPRYLVQKIEKNNISVFETYKKTDKANLKTLIDILKSTEDKADEKIKVEEDRKKNEKAEAEKKEQKRISTIKFVIDKFETDSYSIIQKMTFSEIEKSKKELSDLEDAEFDFEEYDILFEQVKIRIENQLDSKLAILHQQEFQRLENIRLEEEAKEQKRLSDLQAERLNEILLYVAFGEAIDLTKLSELDIDVYNTVLASKKALFEADAKKKQKEEEDAAAKLKEEKEQMYEIRKSRLKEIGFDLNEDSGFFLHKDLFDGIACDVVFDYNSLDFELVIDNQKTAIADFEYEANESKEKAEQKAKETESRIAKLVEAGLKHSEEHDTYFVAADSGWMVLTEQVSIASPEQFEEMLLEAKQAISDYKKSKEDADALKKENKARIKRLASDKKDLSEFIEGLEFNSPIPELQNDESQELLNSIFPKVLEFKKEILEQIKKL